MPRQLWRFKLHCPHADCNTHLLTSAGLYPHLRQVLDLDGYFSLVTEYLECFKCKRKVISWSQAILDQLDVRHRRQYVPCHYHIQLSMCFEGGQINEAPHIWEQLNKLVEQHNEAWMECTAHYLIDCQAFVEVSRQNLIQSPKFHDPPSRPPVPKQKWLLTVFCRGVLERLEEVKVSVTSPFGIVLKINWTKKVNIECY